MTCAKCGTCFDPSEPWSFLKLRDFSFLAADDVREALADVEVDPDRLCAACVQQAYEWVLASGAAWAEGDFPSGWEQ